MNNYSYGLETTVQSPEHIQEHLPSMGLGIECQEHVQTKDLLMTVHSLDEIPLANNGTHDSRETVEGTERQGTGFSKGKQFTIVDTKSNLAFSIVVPEEEAKKRDVDWLFQEYLKTKLTYAINDIAVTPCLKTKDNLLNFDFLLTKPQIPLHVFPDKMTFEPYYCESFTTLNFKSFIILALVGKGAFAQVFLVRRKDTGKIYAMKVIRKEKLLDKEKEEYIFREKRILSQLNHPFLVFLELNVDKASLCISVQ